VRWVVAQPGASFSVEDVYAGLCEALEELDQQVIRFELDTRLTFYSSAHFKLDDEFLPAVDSQQAIDLAINGLYATLYKSRPDVLLVVSGFFVPMGVYELARTYGTKTVILHTESPFEDDRQRRIAEWADLNYLNDPINIDSFPAGTRWMPHAYRPSVHYAGLARSDYICDLAFVGTGYPSRIEFFERMDLSGLDVMLGGNWQAVGEDSPLRPFLANEPDECVDNAEAATIYRSARAGINFYRREAQRPELSGAWACGPREIEQAACGLPFLRDPGGEGDELFPMLPTFASPEEASELLRWWLAHPAEREEAALKARAAVAERTFRNNAVELLRHLERE
jgi:spore maturation protein CgeB